MGGGGGKDGDVARALGYRWTPEQTETLFLRCKVLLDARAAGIACPISGGWFDVRDLEGLRAYAMHLRDLGYRGMHLIHPSHVPVVNEVFSPSTEEIARWRGLVEAVEQGRSQGSAAVTYRGAMVDIAHEQNARAMLEMARELGLLDDKD
jgi:citrate lyase subunit beta/citryl-CoA lyase